MARPLREQFLVATLLVLLPVTIIMTFAAESMYREQLHQLREDARSIAGAVTAHIDQTTAETDDRLGDYLRAIPLPDGSVVTVYDRGGSVVARHQHGGETVEERATSSARVARQPWTVMVEIPTSVAWGRALEIYRGTILISGIATLVLLILEMLFLRRWLPALKYLETSADRVGTGDLRTLPPEPMPSRELDHVRAAFSDMIEKLREAREEIAHQMEEERRMRGEVDSLQRQIIRQERLAAIGVLLSGIAHELNNPLQAISGSAEILQRDPNITPEIRADLSLIHRESARASGIIRNLSRFSRQRGMTPAPVPLRDLINSVIELRRRRLHEEQIEIVVEDRATRVPMAVLTELQQVLLNFVVNAEQSINATSAATRRIVIRTRDVDRGIRIEVEDTGSGVPPEDESKLFQPFFTTKGIGDGTGLGLSVSYGIIRSFGGTIGYHRASSGGAVFFFELPVA